MLCRNSERAIVAAATILFSVALGNNALAQPFTTGDVITLTQDVWGAWNPILANYNSVYESNFGVVEVGIPGAGGFSVVFGDAITVIGYLPSQGTPGPLSSDLVDPHSSSSGGFGGEVLALQLNVDFSDAGFSLGNLGIPFGDLQLRNFPLQSNLNDLTVRQFLGHANNLLGGGSSLFFTIAELYPITRDLNGSFFAGLVYPFAQDHLRIIPGIPGDYNQDNVVDAVDYTVWRNTLGANVANFSGADGNGSGMIDAGDYGVWKLHYGDAAGSGAGANAVPEPTTPILLILGMLASVAFRRSRFHTVKHRVSTQGQYKVSGTFFDVDRSSRAFTGRTHVRWV